DALDVEALRFLHDGLARAEQALGIGIGLRHRQVQDHVAEDFLWRFETEGTGVADVQLDDAVAFLFQALGLLQGRTTDFVADVTQFFRLFDDVHILWPVWCRGWTGAVSRGVEGCALYRMRGFITTGPAPSRGRLRVHDRRNQAQRRRMAGAVERG